MVALAFIIVDRSRETAASVLAGALAFRFFLTLLPLTLVAVVGLGYLRTDGASPSEVVKQFGIKGAWHQRSITPRSSATRGAPWSSCWACGAFSVGHGRPPQHCAPSTRSRGGARSSAGGAAASRGAVPGCRRGGFACGGIQPAYE